jgi:hypothetical protein
MAANEDRPLQLLFRTISRGRGDPAADLIARVAEIKEAKTDLLTDEEYDAWRGMVLNQIVERVRVPLLWQITLALGCLGSVAVIVYGILGGSGAPTVGGCAGLLVAGYSWYNLERDYLTKRRLDRTARLSIVDRLVQMQLLAESEAVVLRAKIVAAFPAKEG